MSLYNMVMGVSTATFFVAPLVVGHPQNNVPRFRDCFLGDEDHPEHDGKIQIYTRIGGNNRQDYQEEIKKMRELGGYITDYDDDFDSTYATFVYEIPKEYQSDVEYYLEGKFEETSKKYQDLIIKTFPKLEEKLTGLFGGEKVSKLKE